jgi:predicted nuclease of predicted toxin-antitoxin system
MRFLVDAQLPPALARFLVANGHLADHVADIGLRDASDSEIWNHASAHHAILVTKDEDFAQRLRQGGNAPVVLWLRIGNTSRRALLAWFGPLLPQIEKMAAQGERLIEVR